MEAKRKRSLVSRVKQNTHRPKMGRFSFCLSQTATDRHTPQKRTRTDTDTATKKDRYIKPHRPPQTDRKTDRQHATPHPHGTRPTEAQNAPQRGKQTDHDTNKSTDENTTPTHRHTNTDGRTETTPKDRPQHATHRKI